MIKIKNMILNSNDAGDCFVTNPKEKEPLNLIVDKINKDQDDLSVEEHRLNHLNDRFLTLENSMNILKGKIKNERKLYRRLIDEIQREKTVICDCTVIPKEIPLDILNIDIDSIKEQIRVLSLPLDWNKCDVSNDKIDLDRIKSNLETYRFEISEIKRKEGAKKKRSATVKMLKEHLDYIEKKCDHELMKLDNIQEDIRQLGMQDGMDKHLEMIYRADSCNFYTNSESPSENNSITDLIDQKNSLNDIFN